MIHNNHIAPLYKTTQIQVEDLQIFHLKCIKELLLNRKDLGFIQEHKICLLYNINKLMKVVSETQQKRTWKQNNKIKIDVWHRLKMQLKMFHQNHERNWRSSSQLMNKTHSQIFQMKQQMKDNQYLLLSTTQKQ